jgi:hypothetical protein
MRISDRRAFAIILLFSLAVCGAVFTVTMWMTDYTGDVDTKSSVTEPPH